LTLTDADPSHFGHTPKLRFECPPRQIYDGPVPAGAFAFHGSIPPEGELMSETQIAAMVMSILIFFTLIGILVQLGAITKILERQQNVVRSVEDLKIITERISERAGEINAKIADTRPSLNHEPPWFLSGESTEP
jgi:hypothetical protein